MGFSVAGGFAIIAAALLATASSMVVALERSYDDFSQGQERDELLRRAQMDTSLSVVSYSYNATSQKLTVQVKNTGTELLKVSETDILVNGAYYTPEAGSSVEGDATTDLWGSNEKLNMTVAVVLNPPSLASLKVVAGNGIGVNLVI